MVQDPLPQVSAAQRVCARMGRGRILQPPESKISGSRDVEEISCFFDERVTSRRVIPRLQTSALTP